MNKQELIRQIAADAEVSQRDAALALNSALDAIVRAVAAGERVSLVGFGSFEARQRPARAGRNPQTGETIEIPAATVPVFRPGVLFKESVDR